MGRKRKPTNVLRMEGAFKRNPKRGRARANEPVPDPELGAPPDYFDDAQKACWVELSGIMPPGVIAKSDRIIVEITARLLAQYRTAEGLPAMMMRQLTSALSSLGLTPADRSKVGVVPRSQGSGWDNF